MTSKCSLGFWGDRVFTIVGYVVGILGCVVGFPSFVRIIKAPLREYEVVSPKSHALYSEARALYSTEPHTPNLQPELPNTSPRGVRVRGAGCWFAPRTPYLHPI